MIYTATDTVGLDGSEIAKVINNVVEQNQNYALTTQTVLQTPFGAGQLTTDKWIITDQLPTAKRFKAPFAAPKSMLPDVHSRQPTSQAHSFAYIMDAWTKSDLHSMYVRQAGQTMPTTMRQADVAALTKFNMRYVEVENRIITAFEVWAMEAMIYGTLQTNPQFGLDISYDYFKTWQVTEADYVAKSESRELTNINFRTLNANGGVTKKCWDVTGGTKAATPVQDVLNFVRSYERRHGVLPAQIITDQASADLLLLDWAANYATDGSNLMKDLMYRTQLRLIPGATVNQEGLEVAIVLPLLNLKGELPATDRFVTVYVYNAFYDKRLYESETQERTNIFPKGWVLCMPQPAKCVKYYGEIPFAFVNYEPMERFVMIKTDPITGDMQGSMHTKPYLGFSDSNAAMAFKVMNVED